MGHDDISTLCFMLLYCMVQTFILCGNNFESANAFHATFSLYADWEDAKGIGSCADDGGQWSTPK